MRDSLFLPPYSRTPIYIFLIPLSQKNGSRTTPKKEAALLGCSLSSFSSIFPLFFLFYFEI
ncbi:hypothetical protein RchiOBHm_Chr3g0471821 [Rosa chinensis]|uniref:Uncharacterized protein n=1 Tax=Rosa chinensis TaxID=74649 RepID=A0A2P6RBH6_ROSCH|nr:hypothetical protein RchiOBHm_Chr3g0471821 [Rosa chinensis]